MLRIICQLKSVTPVTFNKKLKSEKGNNESWDDFEKKVWRERCDVNSSNVLVLSNQRFKKSIITAAQNLNLKIEGEGQSRYQKHFRGGVVVTNSISLGITPDEVDYVEIYTSPRKKDGKRWINFPIVYDWQGDLEINLLDEKITNEIFKKVLDYAGMTVGIGSWRPENGGENGRFECVDIAFEAI